MRKLARARATREIAICNGRTFAKGPGSRGDPLPPLSPLRSTTRPNPNELGLEARTTTTSAQVPRANESFPMHSNGAHERQISIVVGARTGARNSREERTLRRRSLTFVMSHFRGDLAISTLLKPSRRRCESESSRRDFFSISFSISF